nr:PREDICTED: nesprin-4 [Anolis carolinensis]|eukprot:XP_008122997.1 PREDICTED: nesprin-4 [Anolis carolinensis]
MQRVGLQKGPLPLESQPHWMPELDAQDLRTASVERRIRQDEAWQLQKTLQDMIFQFRDWLRLAEAMASSPASSQVSFARSKKELQRFEALQRQVSDKLLPLEALNRQYRRLVQRGGLCPEIKSRVQDVNRRWDALKIWSAAVSKRLKHVLKQREEFESERETLRLWLMELDLRLTDVEHFSGGTSLEKMIQLQAFQEDVQANAERVDHLLVHGERLIQKSHPEDAEILEEELQDLSCFCQEVFRRVFRFRRRLVSMRLVFEDEWLSDRDSDFSEDSLQLDKAEAGQRMGPHCQSTPKKALLPRKKASAYEGGMMDLEWDPSVDVGGSTSHDEEDSSYFSAITSVGLWEEPRRRSRASRWVSGSLPLRSDSREDFVEPNVYGDEWEQLEYSVAKHRRKMCNLGKCLSWEAFEGCHQPQEWTLEKEKGFRLIEPVGFDPERIESWLGQNCQELQAEVQPQDAGTCPSAPVSAKGNLPIQSPATGHQGKPRKPQQRAKKKAKPTPISSPGLASNGQICKEKSLVSGPVEIAVAVKKGYNPGPCLDFIRPPNTIPVWNKARMLLLFFFSAVLLFFFFFAGTSSLPFFKASCLQENGFAKSFHLMLKYTGPPPI